MAINASLLDDFIQYLFKKQRSDGLIIQDVDSKLNLSLEFEQGSDAFIEFANIFTGSSCHYDDDLIQGCLILYKKQMQLLNIEMSLFILEVLEVFIKRSKKQLKIKDLFFQHPFLCSQDYIMLIKKIFSITEIAALEDLSELLRSYVDILPSDTLIFTITQLSFKIFEDKVLYDEVLQSKTLYQKLKKCFENASNLPLLKRSLFLLDNFTTNSANEENKIYSDQRAWEEFIILFEALLETQGHIIKPVLANILTIKDYVLQGRLESGWLFIIFNRLMSQESKLLSRWGMQLFLDLDPNVWLANDSIKCIEKLLFKFLTKTFMFYRPNFINKGSSPPLLTKLEKYFTILFRRMDQVEGSAFLTSLLTFLCSHSLGTNPLVYIFTAIHDIHLGYQLDPLILEYFSKMNRSIIVYQPHNVKGYMQGIILKFISCNFLPSDQLNEGMCLFFNDVWLDYCCSRQHDVWIHTKDLLSHSPSFQVSLDSATAIKGSGLVLALRNNDDDVALLEKQLLYTLLNCGTNLYISSQKVFNSAVILTLHYEYWSSDINQCKLLKIVGRCREKIVDASFAFFERYYESHQEDNCDMRIQENLSRLGSMLIHLLNSDERDDHLKSILSKSGFRQSDALLLGLLINSCYIIRGMLPTERSEPSSQALCVIQDGMKSVNLFTCESSWTVMAYLVHCNAVGPSNELFTDAVDNIQRLKSHAAIEMVYLMIRTLVPHVIVTSPPLFIDCIRPLWATFQDLKNLSVYWTLLQHFCDIVFCTDSLNCEELRDTLVEWWDDLLEASSEKEGIAYHFAASIIKYKPNSGKSVMSWSTKLTDLVLYGVTQSRTKQNIDDIDAFIQKVGDDAPVNMVYNHEPKYASFVRLTALNYLYSLLRDLRCEALSKTVFNHLMEVYNSFDKAALINSLPNRMRIRVVQALLCFMPVIMEHLSGIDFLHRILDMLIRDSQTSVRCFIEIAACFIIMHKPVYADEVLSKILSFKYPSNSYLTSLVSILYHYCEDVGPGSIPELYRNCLKAMSIFASHNNHTIRNFSSSCLVRLCELNPDFIPLEHELLFRYYSQSEEYMKYFKKMIKTNAYFSSFTVSKDLSLVNIFHHLPKHYHILENELCDLHAILGLSPKHLDFEFDCGNFANVPVDLGNTHEDYLLEFRDLTSAQNIQKKITPWQIMASNLGVDFDRSNKSNSELILYASFVDKATNLGGLCRTSEIFGVKTIVVDNRDIINNKDFKSLSLTSEKWVNFEINKCEESRKYFEEMKNNGYTVIGLEQTANSVSMEKFAFPEKSVIVLGKERSGIPVDLIDVMDNCVEIPQLGLIRSLNVHVSASIIIWEYCKQHLFIKRRKLGS